MLLGLGALACSGPPAAPPEDPALVLHREAIVLDTHSDTTPWFQDPAFDFTLRYADGHQDLPRMREGGLDAQFWSIYMGETPGEGRAIRQALERIDAVHELAARHPDQLEIARNAADIRRIVAGGRIAFSMGVEGGHIIEESLPALRTFQRLGVRYLTLTHSFNTSWADSAGTLEPPEPLHDGLAPFGEEVVAELNRLGMLVDVSHVADTTFWDVLRVTRAPVIASHSSVRAVADHPRNLSDPMLAALAQNGGVVMINFYSGYIDSDLVDPIRSLFAGLVPVLLTIREEYATDPISRRRAYRRLMADQAIPRTHLGVLLDHFDHAIAVAGPDHVGLGADWDGVASMPVGMEDVSKLPALTRGLLERGHPPETVRGVLGENLLRVMARAEAVARGGLSGEAAAEQEIRPD